MNLQWRHISIPITRTPQATEGFSQVIKASSPPCSLLPPRGTTSAPGRGPTPWVPSLRDPLPWLCSCNPPPDQPLHMSSCCKSLALVFILRPGPLGLLPPADLVSSPIQPVASHASSQFQYLLTLFNLTPTPPIMKTSERQSHDLQSLFGLTCWNALQEVCSSLVPPSSLSDACYALDLRKPAAYSEFCQRSAPYLNMHLLIFFFLH